MTGGWFRAHPEAWEIARTDLSKVYRDRGEPWPEELVRMDTSWLLDRVHVYAMTGGRKGLRRLPGAKKLGRVWGWTEWAARQWLRTEVGPRGHANVAQPPRNRRAVGDGSTSDIDDDPRNRRATAAQPPRHARERQTPDNRQQTRGSRPCGQLGEEGQNRNQSSKDGRSSSADNAVDEHDPELLTTILRILDRELDLLLTLTHEHRTDAFVRKVAALVTEEAREGLPNAAKWTKRNPSFPDVARVLRWVADENART